MTIVVGVTAPDGIALAADSRCTFGDEVVSDAVQKLFTIRGSAGVAVYGRAEIGGKPIDVLMTEFEISFAAAGLSDDALPASLGQFFDELLGTAYTPSEIDEMTS